MIRRNEEKVVMREREDYWLRVLNDYENGFSV